MSTSRRDFLKTIGATSVAIAGSDLIADLLAQTPPGRVLDSKFKALADVALAEAKRAGCTYADIRFTRAVNSSVTANGRHRGDEADDGDFGEGGFGGGGGRGGGGNFGG